MKKTKRFCSTGLMTMLFIGGFFNLHAQTWSTLGNAALSSTTNFLGSVDGSDLKFRTNNVERMSINSYGFMTIGTTPTQIGSASLVINGNVSGWSGMYANGTTTTTKPFYGYAVNGTVYGYQYYDPTRNGMIFNIASAERFNIMMNGNVGIGVSTPAYKLDVSGDGNFSGNVLATNVYGAIGSFTTVAGGVFKISSSGLTQTGTSNFNVAPKVVFNNNVTCNGYTFDANCIEGSTSDSRPGVTGYAPNSLTLNGFGVYGDANGDFSAYGMACSGNGYYTGIWFAASDAKFKTNVTDVSSALSLVKQLQPKEYEFKRDEYKNMNFPAGPQYGFIAQEVEKVIPNLVGETTQPVDMHKPDGEKINFKMVNYIGLIPVLTEAIQEQQAIIEQQDSMIQEQNKILTQQNERLTRLENQAGQNSSGVNETPKSTNTNQLNQLYPNQPNPFNQETVIKYTIDNNSNNAAIVISDMQGIVQKSIALTQKGEGSITVQAQDLKPGLYSYELIVDGKIVDTKKMMITK